MFYYKRNSSKYFLAFSVLGLGVATILSMYLLKWNFEHFFNFVFLIMPKYKELMDGEKYKFFNIIYIIPIALIALNTYFTTFNIIRFFSIEKINSSSILKYLNNHVVEIFLLTMSIFFFRSALGRSDFEHVAYSSIIIYILSIYIFIIYYLKIILLKIEYLYRLLVYSTIFAVFCVTVFGLYRIFNNELILLNFPFRIDDSKFIGENYINTISFLRTNLKEEDNFFTMTSEAIWYYYINKC
jgi:hypothetical protein